MTIQLRLCLIAALAGATVLSGFPDHLPAPIGKGAIVLAQDDDDDDGDDDDDAPSVRRVLPQFPQFQQPPRQPRAPAPQRQAATPAAQPLAAFAPELVVSSLSATDLATLQAEGFVLLETITLPGAAATLSRLSGPSGQSLEQARDRVRLLPSGGDADFNHYYRGGEGTLAVAAPAPSGCGHANCGAHQLVAWPDASQRAMSCPVTMPIGVIDTAVNRRHEMLQGARIDLTVLGGVDGDPSQRIHGTAVVSAIVGAAGGRVEGLLPEAHLSVVDVFSRDNRDERADVFSLIRGLDLMDQRGIRLVNLSLAGPENTALEGMVRRLVDERGMVLVAAAGNGGPGADTSYPAGYQGVIAVTAVDGRGRIYRLAQRGPHLDLAAPGVALTLATAVRGAREKTGTSFAAPFATAAAALVLAREPQLTPAQVAERLTAATRDLGAEGHDEVFGYGLIRADGLCSPKAP